LQKYLELNKVKYVNLDEHIHSLQDLNKIPKLITIAFSLKPTPKLPNPLLVYGYYKIPGIYKITTDLQPHLIHNENSLIIYTPKQIKRYVANLAVSLKKRKKVGLNAYKSVAPAYLLESKQNLIKLKGAIIY